MLAASAGVAQTTVPNSAAPPSAPELRIQADRILAHQHSDDQILDQYERIERTEERKSASDASPASVKVLRVFPAGPGNGRIPLGLDGKPPDAAAYVRDLRTLERSLAWAVQDGRPQRDAYAKLAQKRKEHANLLDATRQAYTLTWLGRESRDGRTLGKLRLDPDPSYKPVSRMTSILTKIRAVVWFDEQSGHLARFEGEFVGDVTFGGGIVAKVYKGGRFVMDQIEVAPDVWLPAYYQYDFDGRKFFFGFGVHQKIWITGYRRVGPPREAIQIVRGELNNLSAGHSDP